MIIEMWASHRRKIRPRWASPSSNANDSPCSPPLTPMPKNNTVILNRREFIAFSAPVAAILGLPGCMGLQHNPRKPRPIAAGAKVRFAQIGCGGKGFSDGMAQKDEDVVAMCDIDWVAKPTTTKDANGKTIPAPSNVQKLMAE